MGRPNDALERAGAKRQRHDERVSLTSEMAEGVP
jgi:hypothetical protein